MAIGMDLRKEQDHGIETKIFSQSISGLRSAYLKTTTWKILEAINMKNTSFTKCVSLAEPCIKCGSKTMNLIRICGTCRWREYMDELYKV